MRKEQNTWLDIVRLGLVMALSALSMPAQYMVSPAIWQRWRAFVRKLSGVEGFAQRARNKQYQRAIAR